MSEDLDHKIYLAGKPNLLLFSQPFNKCFSAIKRWKEKTFMIIRTHKKLAFIHYLH